MSLAKAEEILNADWSSFHDPLCPENIGDGECSCKVTHLLQAAATVKLFRTTMTCPRCDAALKSYHSGIMCPICKMYYEFNSWWTVGCDENHAHTKKCLHRVEGDQCRPSR